MVCVCLWAKMAQESRLWEVVYWRSVSSGERLAGRVTGAWTGVSLSASSTCPGPIGLSTGRLASRAANITGHYHQTLQCNPCYRSSLLKTCFPGWDFSLFSSISSAKLLVVPRRDHDNFHPYFSWSSLVLPIDAIQSLWCALFEHCVLFFCDVCLVVFYLIIVPSIRKCLH